MNFSMLLILFGVSAQMLEAENLLRRLQGDLLCQSGQVYDYPYNNGNIKICQNGQTVLNYVGTAAQCHCPEGTWNDNYSGRCITSCGGSDESTHKDDINNNLCQSNSGQIYGVPYNNGHVKICLNGETVWNFIGTDAQCHCPEGKWNDNYKGNCIDYCPPSVPSESSNLCQIGSGQIYDIPYNNGYINICQHGQTVLNYVGTNAQCHCPQGTWNDNYSGQCIHTCQSDHVAHGDDDNNNNNNNLCQIGSGQVFGIPPNNGQVAVCLNGEIIFNFVGRNEQCHCPDETFNDNFTGQCIEECNPLHDDNNNERNNLCQIGSGQIYGVPYNNGNIKICQNGHTVLNFVGTNAQCHCPQNTWNDNYTGQCINSCH